MEAVAARESWSKLVVVVLADQGCLTVWAFKLHLADLSMDVNDAVSLLQASQ